MSDPEYGKVTEMHHVVVAAGTMALAYYALVRPLMSTGPDGKLVWMGLAVAAWAVIVPALMIATSAHEATLTGEAFFVVLKLVSVCVGVVTMQSFIAFFHLRGHVSTFGLTLLMNLIVIVNIGEAVMTGAKKFFDDDGHTVDLLNALVGFGLMVILFYQIFKGPGMKVLTSQENKKIRLRSDYRPWFIMSYTVWNMLFRSRLAENTNSLMFFMVTLLLPIIEHFNGEGDWLQVRGATLLAHLVLVLGITPGEGRIFPAYNRDGFWANGDEKSIFSVGQKSEYYRWAMLVGAAVTLALSTWEAYVQSETFFGVFTTKRREVERFDQSKNPYATRDIAQVRMHKRAQKSNSFVAYFSIGCVAVLSITSSVLENVVGPETSSNTGLSKVLAENCLGSSCWFFGVTLASFFLIALVFYAIHRVSPLVSFVSIFVSMIFLAPFAISFETMDTPFEYLKLISIYVTSFFMAIFRFDNMIR